jgi:hypothetical protein
MFLFLLNTYDHKYTFFIFSTLFLQWFIFIFLTFSHLTPYFKSHKFYISVFFQKCIKNIGT